VANTGTTLDADPRVATAATSGAARWARGGTVGLTAAGLALLGHVVGGGEAPPTTPLLLLTLVAVLGSVGLSGRRWSIGTLLGVLLCAQAAFHVAFGDQTTQPSGTSAHLHHGAASAAMSTHPMGWRMAGAHLMAVLVTALLLRRGEAWCWQLAALFATPARVLRLCAAPTAPITPSAPSAVRVEHTSMFGQARLLVLAQSRRGPPVARAA
jgi:hypothetical protein